MTEDEESKDLNRDEQAVRNQEPLPVLEAADLPESHSEKVQPAADELYGVSEAEPRVYPSRRTEQNPVEKDAERQLSLEEIYSRRREQDRTASPESGSEESEEIDLSVPLPRHPFITRLFRPLLNPGMILKFSLLASILWVFLFPAFGLFQHSVRKCFLSENRPGVSVKVELKPEGNVHSGGNFEMMTAEELTKRLSGIEKFFLGPKGEVLIGGLKRFGYYFLFPFFFWGIFAVPFFLQISEQTSCGDDKISGWPDWTILQGIGRFAWFFLLLLTAGLPGYFLFFPLGAAGAGFFLSELILFPVFYLSTADTDSFFCLLSKNILKGIRFAAGAWRNCMIVFFIISLLAGVFFLGTLGWGIFAYVGIPQLAGFALIAAFFLTLYLFFVFRLLGRLAWVLKEKIQNNNAEEEV